MSNISYTPAQQQVLDFPANQGNLLIVACAGSGKTQVLSRRIALLVSRGVKQENIVAFTFTEKAAGELKSRIRRELTDLKQTQGLANAELGDMYVGTIHAFCLQLLRDLDPKYHNFNVMDEAQQLACVVSNYYDGLQLNIFKNSDELKSKKEIITRFIATLGVKHRENIDTASLQDSRLRHSLEQYEQLTKNRPLNMLSFDDIIGELISLLRRDPAVLAKAQQKFSHIFVDEYQDVDDRQEELIQLLSDVGQSAQVCAVGDDDQAIYAWRGASVQNILSFEQRYPQVTRVTLDINFRSTDTIVALANNALVGSSYPQQRKKALEFKGIRPDRRLAKTMRPQHMQDGQLVNTPAGPGEVWVCELTSSGKAEGQQTEAAFIADHITELIGHPWPTGAGERGLAYSDMAILYRSLGSSQALRQELKERGIPFVVKGIHGLFMLPEIALCHCAFCYILGADYQPVSEAFGNRAASIEPRAQPHFIKSQLEQLTSRMPDANWGDLETWLQTTQNKIAKEATKAKQKRGWITYHLNDLLYDMLNCLGATRGERWGADLLYALGSFSKILEDFELVHPQLTPSKMRLLAYFLNELVANNQDEINNPDPGTPNAVQIMTIHRAKGLEWPVVFVPNVKVLSFPSSYRNRAVDTLFAPGECQGRPKAITEEDKNERDEEELRLWYVALTRSQRFLFLSVSTWFKSCPSDLFKAARELATRHDALQVCLDPDAIFPRPVKLESQPSPDTAILPTNFSQISKYWLCPQSFEFREMMGFGAEVHEALGYGKQIHNGLATLHERLCQAPDAVNPQWIKDQVEANFTLCYANPLQQKIMKETAKKVLIDYWTRMKDQLAGHELKSEKPFEFLLGDAMISGSIDLLHNTRSDDPRVVEIVDFKTTKEGQDDEGETAKLRHQNVERQLQLYAIAAQDALGLAPEKAVAHFLNCQGQQRQEIALTPEALDHTRAEVETAVQSIKAGKFPSQPSALSCNLCDYWRLCPKQQKRHKK